MQPTVSLETPVRVLMNRSVVHLEEHDTLEEAADLMARAKISCIVVCRSLRPRGILTERDLAVLYASSLKNGTDVPVSSVMQSPVSCVSCDDTLESVLEAVERLTIRHIPVIDAAGRLAGLLTQTDLLRLCASILRAGV